MKLYITIMFIVIFIITQINPRSHPCPFTKVQCAALRRHGRIPDMWQHTRSIAIPITVKFCSRAHSTLFFHQPRTGNCSSQFCLILAILFLVLSAGTITIISTFIFANIVITIAVVSMQSAGVCMPGGLGTRKLDSNSGASLRGDGG